MGASKFLRVDAALTIGTAAAAGTTTCSTTGTE